MNILILVRESSADPSLEDSLTVEKDSVLGRSEECDFQINDTALSRRHCRIDFTDREVRIEDLGSRNGTVVNKKKINRPVPLKTDDEIIIGKNVFRVQIHQKESTVSFDSLNLSSLKKQEITEEHDRDVLSEDEGIQSPVSMELDRRLIDGLQDDLHDGSTRKSFFNFRKLFSERLRFQEMVLQAPSFVREIQPADFKTAPFWKNFTLMTFLWTFVTSYLIHSRIKFQESGLLDIIMPQSQAAIFFKSFVMGILLLISILLIFLFLSYISWNVYKIFRIRIGYDIFLKLALTAFFPSAGILLAGSVLIILFSGTLSIFFELIRFLGVIIMAFGSLFFYYLLFLGLKKMIPDSSDMKMGRLYFSFFVVFFLTCVSFGAATANINNWKSIYEKAFNWETEFLLAHNLLEKGKLRNAKAKLEEILVHLPRLSQKQKADTYFTLGVVKVLNDRKEEGEKDIETGMFFADDAQKSAYIDVMEKYGVRTSRDYHDRYKKYMAVDASHKRQDDVITLLLLDIDQYSGKDIVIKNILYERFGFQNAQGFKNSDPWFNHPDTYILEPSDLMKGKEFMFFFHPREDDREARKFVMSFTGKSDKSFYIEALKGKLVKHMPEEGRILYIFMVREMTVNYMTYEGTVPKDIIKKNGAEGHSQ